MMRMARPRYFSENFTSKNPSRFYSTTLANSKQLQYQLKQINPTSKRVLEERYLLSNETGWYDVLKKLKAFPQLSKPSSACAWLSGESRFLSILPVLPKTVIFNDIDPDVHDNIRLMLEVILNSDHKDEFIEKYYHLSRERLLDDIAPDEYHYRRDLKKIGSDLREFDFLHSQERYLICKQVAQATKIFYSHCNLFDKNHMSKFSGILSNNGLRLTLMNISNIRDYDANNHLPDSIDQLARHQPHILHSTLVSHAKGVETLPPMTYSEFKQELNIPKSHWVLNN